MSHDLNNNNSNVHNPNQDVDYQKAQRQDDYSEHPANLSKRGHSSKQGAKRHRGGRNNNKDSQKPNQQGGLEHAASNLVPTFRQGRWVKESISMEFGQLAQKLAKQMEVITRRQNRHTGVNERDNLRVFRWGMYAMQALASEELVAFDPGTVQVPQIFMLFWAQVRPLHDSERMVKVELDAPGHVYFDQFGRYDGFLEHTPDAEELMSKARLTPDDCSKEELKLAEEITEFANLTPSQETQYYKHISTAYIKEYISNELLFNFEVCFGLPVFVPAKTSEIYHIAVDQDGNLISVPSVIPTGTALAIRAAFQFVELSKLFGPHNFAFVNLDSFDDWVRSHVLLNMLNMRPESYQG